MNELLACHLHILNIINLKKIDVEIIITKLCVSNGRFLYQFLCGFLETIYTLQVDGVTLYVYVNR